MRVRTHAPTDVPRRRHAKRHSPRRHVKQPTVVLASPRLALLQRYLPRVHALDQMALLVGHKLEMSHGERPVALPYALSPPLVTLELILRHLSRRHLIREIWRRALGHHLPDRCRHAGRRRPRRPISLHRGKDERSLLCGHRLPPAPIAGVHVLPELFMHQLARRGCGAPQPRPHQRACAHCLRRARLVAAVCLLPLQLGEATSLPPAHLAGGYAHRHARTTSVSQRLLNRWPRCFYRSVIHVHVRVVPGPLPAGRHRVPLRVARERLKPRALRVTRAPALVVPAHVRVKELPMRRLGVCIVAYGLNSPRGARRRQGMLPPLRHGPHGPNAAHRAAPRLRTGNRADISAYPLDGVAPLTGHVDRVLSLRPRSKHAESRRRRRVPRPAQPHCQLASSCMRPPTQLVVRNHRNAIPLMCYGHTHLAEPQRRIRRRHRLGQPLVAHVALINSHRIGALGRRATPRRSTQWAKDVAAAAWRPHPPELIVPVPAPTRPQATSRLERRGRHRQILVDVQLEAALEQTRPRHAQPEQGASQLRHSAPHRRARTCHTLDGPIIEQPYQLLAHPRYQCRVRCVRGRRTVRLAGRAGASTQRPRLCRHCLDQRPISGISFRESLRPEAPDIIVLPQVVHTV